jgi:hypothetical protein
MKLKDIIDSGDMSVALRFNYKAQEFTVEAGRQWLTPAILATSEAEFRRIID